ncbi:MAG TPA: hypothetical protein VG733_03430 [Chthoniobacteraceae bacterium]|nr:hypothetical protein [Chthoniobacteraceae bacterium]
MFHRSHILSAAVATAFLCATAVGDQQLSKEDLAKVVKTDAVTVPTPGEIMAALNKQATKPNWQTEYRKPIPTTFVPRTQIALNLGGLIADGYIAVEAEDTQQVKNTGRDILALAKHLSVNQDILARMDSITEFAEKNEWNTLKEELEETQNEVKDALEERKDQDLVILVTIGGWVRGTQVVSSWIADNYTPEAARLIRQPALVAYLRSKLNDLSPKTRSDDPSLIKSLDDKLTDIEKLVSFPKDTAPTLDDVKKLRDAATALETEISTKP